MRATELMLVYSTVGAAIGVAWLWYRPSPRRGSGRFATAFAAALFWPLFLPWLLRPGADSAEEWPAESEFGRRAVHDGPLEAALRDARARLERAIAAIRSSGSPGLDPVLARVPALCVALGTQAREVDELGRFVASAPVSAAPTPTALEAELEAARDAGRERLRAVYTRRTEELSRAIVRLEDLIATVELARFTREPSGGAARLDNQIARAVEALTALVSDEAEVRAAEKVAWSELARSELARSELARSEAA